MPRKKIPPLSAIQILKRIADASLRERQGKSVETENVFDVDSLGNRVKLLLGIVKRQKKSRDRMLFFVMYDIEINKGRTLVHKYLKRNGCFPIQRSIFLADTDMDTYNQIKSDLAAVQGAYENNDSIIVLPVSTDYLRMMKIIGQKIEIDVITHSRNTLFF